jgi:hypothetical protein
MIETTNDWHEPYTPETATNEQLADDWRLFVAAIANLDAGKDEPFTYEDIYARATACIREIVKRVCANKKNSSVSSFSVGIRPSLSTSPSLVHTMA